MIYPYIMIIMLSISTPGIIINFRIATSELYNYGMYMLHVIRMYVSMYACIHMSFYTCDTLSKNGRLCTFAKKIL